LEGHMVLYMLGNVFRNQGHRIHSSEHSTLFLAVIAAKYTSHDIKSKYME